jgi:prepilin-type N-terminal cleavage/methylation domain-containing protein
MSRNDNRLRHSGGFSLIELLAVISIVGILLGIAVISGHDWIVRSQVEAQTREMFADLMSARVSAMQRNRVYFVKMAANQYAIYEDTYDPANPTSPDGDGWLQVGNDRPVMQKDTRYALDSFGTTTFNFSNCGTCELASGPSNTIHIVSTAAPSFDCIILSTTRLLMGKWNGTDCTPQ